MNGLSSLPFAEVGRPLFGNQWLALLAILAGIAVLMIVVAIAGRWLAASHPDPIVNTPASAPSSLSPAETDAGPSPETFVAIAAAISVLLGSRARIAGVRQLPPPNVETLMQQWSLEGRRQIYSSHQVR